MLKLGGGVGAPALPAAGPQRLVRRAGVRRGGGPASMPERVS